MVLSKLFLVSISQLIFFKKLVLKYSKTIQNDFFSEASTLLMLDWQNLFFLVRDIMPIFKNQAAVTDMVEVMIVTIKKSYSDVDVIAGDYLFDVDQLDLLTFVLS